MKNVSTLFLILLVYFLLSGKAALKGRIITVYRLAIMPLIFIVWSLFSLYDKTTFSLLVYPISLLAGNAIGYAMMHRLTIPIDKYGRVHMPGSVLPLIISCSFLVTKNCLRVYYVLHPELKLNAMFTGFDAAFSGIFTGIALGIFLNILYRYRKSFYKKF